MQLHARAGGVAYAFRLFAKPFVGGHLRFTDNLLGTNAELWLGMQEAYDLWQASQQPRPSVQRTDWVDANT